MIELEAKSSDLAGAQPRWVRAGIVLLALSFVIWAPLPVVPFLPLDLEVRTGLGAGLFLSAEITFWVGVALVGPETAKRLRSRLRPRRASNRSS